MYETHAQGTSFFLFEVFPFNSTKKMNMTEIELLKK